MTSVQTSQVFAKASIDAIEITTDFLADRGGLLPIMRYLIPQLTDIFKLYRAIQKGVAADGLLERLSRF